MLLEYKDFDDGRNIMFKNVNLYNLSKLKYNQFIPLKFNSALGSQMAYLILKKKHHINHFMQYYTTLITVLSA